MKKIFLILIVVLLMGGLMVPMGADAISLMDNVSSGCRSNGSCSVCDMLVVVYNAGRFIFMSMAGISLVLLLWAGIGLIFNWGSAEMVAANKKLIFHTLLAIVIIMAAFALVNVLVTVLADSDPGPGVNIIDAFWDDGEWFRGPTCE